MKNEDPFFFSVVSHVNEDYNKMLVMFQDSIKTSGIKLKHNLLETGMQGGDWQSATYLQNVYQKLEITHAKLKEGKRVVCSDVDIIFYRDFTPLIEKNNHLDIIFSVDHQFFCTGFFYARPTPETIKLFNHKIPIKKWEGDQGDQGYINYKLADMQDELKDLKIGYIHPSIAPYGKYIFDEEQEIKKPYLAHFNWTIGNKEKIQKMEKYKNTYRHEICTIQ
jgi:hypothetical protein